MGPAHRHPGAHASARGPRGGPGAAALAIPRRPGVRTRDDRAGTGLRRVGGDLRAWGSAARTARDRRPAHPRFDPIPRPVAGCQPGPGASPGRRHVDQQRVDRAPRRGGRAALPAGRRRGGGRRSRAARARPAAARPAEGRPSRLEDGQHAGLPRDGSAEGGRRLGGTRQPVRPSGPGDHRAPARARRHHLSHRPGRVGGRRARWPDGPCSHIGSPGGSPGQASANAKRGNRWRGDGDGDAGATSHGSERLPVRDRAEHGR